MTTVRTDRATLARLAAHERWARVPDRTAATAAARQAASDRFLRLAEELHPGGDPKLLDKVAANLKSAHMIRAARARWNGKAADAATPSTALEDADAAAPRR